MLFDGHLVVLFLFWIICKFDRFTLYLHACTPWILSYPCGEEQSGSGMGEGRGGPDPAFPPLFHENPAFSTFFISFSNSAFLSQKNTLKSLISYFRLIFWIYAFLNTLYFSSFLRYMLFYLCQRNMRAPTRLSWFPWLLQKEIAFSSSVWRELALLFAISRPIER